MSEQNKNLWISKLANRAGELAEELELTEKQTEKLKDFVFSVAREQYRAGNSAGIRWGRMNPVQPKEEGDMVAVNHLDM